jgi:hypothetical protein
MGYIGNFVALSALMVLPFAGYGSVRDLMVYNRLMPHHDDGWSSCPGSGSSQAILIGVLFLGLELLPLARYGAHSRRRMRFRPWIKYS